MSGQKDAHDLRLTASDDAVGIPVEVSLTEHLGRNNIVVCTPRGEAGFLLDEDEAIQVETAPGVFYDSGTELTLTAEAAGVRVFSAEGATLEDGGAAATAAPDGPDAGAAGPSEQASAE